jgi:hypothetical protein
MRRLVRGRRFASQTAISQSRFARVTTVLAPAVWESLFRQEEGHQWQADEAYWKPLKADLV